MQYFYLMLFLTSATHPVAGLKLLVDSDLVEDDDETWESDVLFSLKPFQGKCKRTTVPTPMAETPTPTRTIACPEAVQPAQRTDEHDENGYPAALGCQDVGGGSFKYMDNKGYAAQGEISSITCDSSNAPSKKKYCTDVTSNPPTTSFQGKLASIYALTGAAKYPIKKFVHYAAKLTTMGNIASAAHTTTAGDAIAVVKSYELNSANYATNFKAFTNEAELGTYPTSSGDKDYYCYSTKVMMWAKNDPKVQNIRGEEFEIMATGTFSLLSLRQAQKTVLEASATIDRAGSRCGATYIQNLTLSGQWVEDVGLPEIQVKAEASVPKAQALQINLGEDWQTTVHQPSHLVVTKSNAREIVLKLNKLKVFVSVDSHRVHEEGVKTRRFANFLNVNFQGIAALPADLLVGGLLGTDSHEAVTQLPDECGSAQLLAAEEQSMYSDMKIA